MFDADEATAREWPCIKPQFDLYGRYCPRCATTRTHVVPAISSSPYVATDCRSYFSTGQDRERQRKAFNLRRCLASGTFAFYLDPSRLRTVCPEPLALNLHILRRRR